MTDSELHKTRRRLRLRFSLRTFLLVVTMFSLWLGYNIRAANIQRQAVAKIREYGGEAYYGYQRINGEWHDYNSSWIPAWLLSILGEDFFHTIVGVNLNNSFYVPPGQDAPETRFRLLLSFPKLEYLSLAGASPSVANLSCVGELSRLDTLVFFNGGNVTDEGVAKLERLKRLKCVFLNESNITDKSLLVFSRMPGIEQLLLQRNCFSDEGVSQLASLKRLKCLLVSGNEEEKNEITDESLQFLLELPGFEELDVRDTRVSQDFVDKFMARFPNGTIKRL